MAPVNLCCANSNTSITIKWAKVEYETGGLTTSVDDVTMSMVEADMSDDIAALGAWYDIEVPHGVNEEDGWGLVLTARVLGDKLFMPAETTWFPYRKVSVRRRAELPTHILTFGSPSPPPPSPLPPPSPSPSLPPPPPPLQLTTGCCADKMHVHDRTTGTPLIHDVSAILDIAMPEVEVKGNSHTFDVVQDVGGEDVWVVLDIQ